MILPSNLASLVYMFSSKYILNINRITEKVRIQKEEKYIIFSNLVASRISRLQLPKDDITLIIN
jgi:hypothetical protein